MISKRPRISFILESILPWVVLAVLLFYTYLKTFEHPYAGIRWGSNWTINALYNDDGNSLLKPNDRVIQIGPLPYSEFKDHLYVKMFEGVQKGDIVPMTIVRGGQHMTVMWKYPGFTDAEFQDITFSEEWLAFLFWIVGTLAFFNIHPKKMTWALMVAFTYLTALWIAFGGGASFFHIGYSAYLMRIAIWFCVPVYLHFHWVFPQPLGTLSPKTVWGCYIAAGLFSLAEVFSLPPHNLFYVGFFIAIVGSLWLLIAHAILQKQSRRALRWLLLAVVFALLPTIIIMVMGALEKTPNWGGMAVIGLPFLPLAYFYVLFRRQMGTAEIRVNRFISTYILILFLISIFIPLGSLFVAQGVASDQAHVFLAVVIFLLTIIAAISLTVLGFRHFEEFISHRILDIPQPPASLHQAYATRITTSTSIQHVVDLLKVDILPSLNIQQFVFLRLEQNSSRLLLAMGAPLHEIPKPNELPDLLATAGRYRPIEIIEDTAHPWVRLVLPLKVEKDLIGVWLFGRRNPDDMYYQNEISALESLASQTAIAVSNAIQTERLREMYQVNIERNEQERLRLALDLHDSVLNEMAALLMTIDHASVPENFMIASQALTDRLREIVSDLRPPMLNYGLKPGIEDLAETLVERSKDTIEIMVEIEGEVRYEQKIEQNLFRIVQEACENAIRHGHAHQIRITGALSAQRIELAIQDDGSGFKLGTSMQLHDLLAHKHFGLAGMTERAAMLGGEARIESIVNAGTRISIHWQALRE